MEIKLASSRSMAIENDLESVMIEDIEYKTIDELGEIWNFLEECYLL